MRLSLIIGSLLTLPFSIYAAPVSSQTPHGPHGNVLQTRVEIKEVHALPKPPPFSGPSAPLPKPDGSKEVSSYKPHTGPSRPLPRPGSRRRDLISRMMPITPHPQPWAMLKAPETHTPGVPIWKKPPENTDSAKPNKDSEPQKRDLVGRMMGAGAWKMMAKGSEAHPAGVPIWKNPAGIDTPAPAADAIADSKPVLGHGPEIPADVLPNPVLKFGPEGAVKLPEKADSKPVLDHGPEMPADVLQNPLLKVGPEGAVKLPEKADSKPVLGHGPKMPEAVLESPLLKFGPDGAVKLPEKADSKPVLGHGPEMPEAVLESPLLKFGPDGAVKLLKEKLGPNEQAAKPEAEQLVSRAWRLKDSPQPRPVLDHTSKPQYRDLVRRVTGGEALKGGKSPSNGLNHGLLDELQVPPAADGFGPASPRMPHKRLKPQDLGKKKPKPGGLGKKKPEES